MKNNLKISIGENTADFSENGVTLKPCTIEGEVFYKIENINEIRPFFMSIASASNHWMFLSSNGAISAGRKNADNALFPYYTDDKITESAEITGCKSIFIVKKNAAEYLWEPFSERYEGVYKTCRNLYKSRCGNKVIFEEVNSDLQLTYRYQWNSSDKYGFVRSSCLVNSSDSVVDISVLDGLQNIMPYGVPCYLQNSTSNLADAYKRSELVRDGGLAIFALSAIIVDKPEPSEALKANTVFSLGLEGASYLLSSLQLSDFRRGVRPAEECDVKGEKGAYFVLADITLQPLQEKQWLIVANVNQSQSAIVSLLDKIKKDKNLPLSIQEDIDADNKRLIELVASSDGLQRTADKLTDARHFSNTMFNIMRGGIFDYNYQIDKEDFVKYLAKANVEVFKAREDILNQCQPKFSLESLYSIAEGTGDSDFRRLCIEYLPLTFSRRHGDPSRPWNIFSINTKDENTGSKILDYQGNWRDIFQNWEALAHSYPCFLSGMIFKFLNASTFDGYNPYRVMKDGFDWETIEPDNQWSFIGYWGDHQIIYLLKLLELMEEYQPEVLESYFNDEVFVYANVPYKIKCYSDILKNSKDTILFDAKLDRAVRDRRELLGADGALLEGKNGKIVKVTFIEKIMASLLAKMSNFIPDGGIWMNTQRPEWNDANNALVGNGTSMVTLYYLRRFLCFLRDILSSSHTTEFSLSAELMNCFSGMFDGLVQHAHMLDGRIDNAGRKLILDCLAQPASDYRLLVYEQSFSGEKVKVALDTLLDFINLSLKYLENSIANNKRDDNMYHSYNLMTLENQSEIAISHLSEMLEGQVAVLSSGMLSSSEALQLLDSLRNSKLYREDQNSYILYPDRQLPHFLEKNNIPAEEVGKSELLQMMVEEGDNHIVEKDVEGHFHFNGNFKNANDLKAQLKNLSNTSYSKLAEKEQAVILEIFEKVFNHKAFTGRSGTFYAYEGLGSIYWHMVSKLELAVQECCRKAILNNDDKALISNLVCHFYDISAGIGVHKSPVNYGAFPTDPYSHTPAGKGVKQPGMTGQVKEDILNRFGVLGVFVQKRKLTFYPFMLRREEFLTVPETFRYIDVSLKEKELSLGRGSLCFTYCQVPVIYHVAEENDITVYYSDGEVGKIKGNQLDESTSREVFWRTGKVCRVEFNIDRKNLNN